MPYLTPDVPQGYQEVHVLIPETLNKIFWAILLDLTKAYFWELFGALDVLTVLDYIDIIISSITYGPGPAIPPLIVQEDSGETLRDDYNQAIIQE